MCIAVSALVKSVSGKKAMVEYKGNIIEVSTGIVSPKVGDYCLIHAGCAVEIIDESQAIEIDEILDLINGAISDDR